MEKEYGICEVAKEGSYTVGIVRFKGVYSSPPQVQLTPSQEGRPGDWAGLICSVLSINESEMVIDFDGWKIINGVPTFQQEVYPGAKCYWNVM